MTFGKWFSENICKILIWLSNELNKPFIYELEPMNFVFWKIINNYFILGMGTRDIFLI